MQTVFDILEWPAVLEHLDSCCQTGYGRLLVNDESLFLPDAEAIHHEMQRVEEAKLLILRYGDVTLQETPDIIPMLHRLRKEGEVQTPGELAELLQTLKTLRQLVRFFLQNRSKELMPTLLAELDEVSIPNTVIEELENLVSESGDLLNSASETYAQLRGRIKEVQQGIRQHLQNMINRPTVSKYLQEPIITEREGRSVLPVRAEHKVDVPGIVHATSATGVTLYIEPRGVVEQNNRLISLRGELEREIRLILRRVSQSLHPFAAELEAFMATAAQLDLLMAKARQSLRLKANPLRVAENSGALNLIQARHPLLLLQTDAVVPNDVIMHSPKRIMLITGPNTGGKTVLLKLVGLFALMLRAGLHVPAKENSSMSLFHPVLADIGDPQSITQNLSTFSGHIGRLNAFLNEPDLSESLILVDEICAGTDPHEGSALAKALLETLHQRGATCIVTTHIGELKVFAHQKEGYLNASVEFDAETLSPTYRLILGVPGTSNALNIAARLGIESDVIGLARSHLSQNVSDSAQLIESLETKNRKLAFELEEAKRLRVEVQWEEEQVRTQLNRLEGEKKKTLQMFREGIKDKLRLIEQEVDELKKEVQQPQPTDRRTVQQLSGRFRKVQGQTGEFFVEEQQKLYPKPGLDWDALKIGDMVESHSLNLSGTIIEKNDARRELTIQAGILKTTVPFSDIVQKHKPQPKPKHKRVEPQGRVVLQPKSMAMECDVRGMNAEDAIGVLDKFLDDAMVSGFSTVGVIHGLGTGVLKKTIRQYLKELPYIKSFGPAPANDGGDGKTIVDLK